MSDSWKNHGGTRTNAVVSTSIADNTKNIHKTDSTLSTEDTEGIYYYKEGGPSTFGVGTKRPHSRLSFGDYLVNNIDSNGNVKAESLVNNAAIAFSEDISGANATGIAFYREGVANSSADTRGLRFVVNNNSTSTTAATSGMQAISNENTLMLLTNDGETKKVLINSKSSNFANAGSGLEVNGDIRLTKNLILKGQTGASILKEEGLIFYDSTDKKLKWCIGASDDIHTIAGINDTGFVINSNKYDLSFSLVTNGDTGLLAFKDLGLCIGNGEMVATNYLNKYNNATKRNIPALSVIGHSQNGTDSNGNILVSDISGVTGNAILSKTSPSDISANGVIYLQNNVAVGVYEPAAIIDVSKADVPFLNMGTDITNYRNSVIVGHDISGSSNSFYFGKEINNSASSDASYNFLFGNNLTINGNATNFRNNLIFGSGNTGGGDHNLIFGNSLTTANDVSYCVLLGNGSGSAQLGDLIKYFEDGTAVFQVKSGGNMILTGDISANDASFNNVVFSNIGNETNKIKLVFVKDISAENISIENTLNVGGDLSGNDASFNNIDVNYLKGYGNMDIAGKIDVVGNGLIGGNLNVTGNSVIVGDLSCNDASFNNFQSVGNGEISGKLNIGGNIEIVGDLSANDASFNIVTCNSINSIISIISTGNDKGINVNGKGQFTTLRVGGNEIDSASSAWSSTNSKDYSGNINSLYLNKKVGVNFDVETGKKIFSPKFPLDVSGVVRSQNQVFGSLSIDLIPQSLSNYTNTITNDIYGSGVYDVSEASIVNSANPVWQLFDNSANTHWESQAGSVNTVIGISGNNLGEDLEINVSGKYIEIILPQRCTIKHYAFQRRDNNNLNKIPKTWWLIGKIGLDAEVTSPNNKWKVIDYKTIENQNNPPYGANNSLDFFTVDDLLYSNDMFKVLRFYISKTFTGEITDASNCQMSKLKLYGEPSNITDVSSSLIQTELYDISGSILSKQKHLSLQPLGGNVGIRTNNASVILDISANDAIRLPRGNTSERPADMDASGCLRYNTETKQFEGYGDAGWAGLGGVIDKDQDTYIAAEKYTDEDMLRFYTAGQERMIIKNTGVVDVSGLLQSKDISGNDISGNHIFANAFDTNGVTVNGVIHATGNITSNGNIISTGDISGVNVEFINVVANDGSFNIVEMKQLYADEKIGIGTKTPSVLLDISGTGAIRLPVGNTNSRPANVDASGCLRYNSETKQFEGYGEGSWGGLGGVMSLDMNTKITAHNNNGLEFFTDGKKRMTITEDNHANIDISDARVNIINSTLDCSGITTNTLNAIGVSSENITIVNDLNGNDASFNNIVKVSDLRVYKDASFYCDISGSDASFNIVDAGKLTVADDLSSNNLIISNTSTLNNVNCRVMEVIGDLSCNDASFNHIAEISHLKVNNTSYFFGDISGVDASFNNVDMNGKVSIAGHLGGNDASFNVVDMNKLTITGDLSGNNALLHDVSVNRLWIGDVEMIGYIPGAVNAPTNTGTLTGNMIFNGDISANGFFELNGDLSGNDASFNVVDMKQLNVNETIKAATLMYGTTNVETEMDTKATITYVNNQITGLIDGAPGALDTLNELAAALSDNANYATTITNSLALKAPLANPTFTGTVNGISSTMVGLGNVTNESKTTMFANPTFTGTVNGISSTMVGLGNVTNESKTTMFANPTFTGKVGIITNDPSYNLHINGTISDPYLKNPSNVTPTWYGSLHCGTDISGITMGRCTRNGQNTSSAHYNGIQSHSLGVGTSLTINPFGGNVGIGTNNPKAKLNVAGKITSTDNTIPSNYGGNVTTTCTFGHGNGSSDDYFGLNIGTLWNESSYIQVCKNSSVDSNHKLLLNPNGGNVGIGLSSPDFPLHVSGQKSSYGYTFNGWYGAGGHANSGYGPSTSSQTVSGYFSHDIWAVELLVSSDERIKENIRDVSDNASLQKLRDISCCFYEYKDKVKRSSLTTIGFIAQQVKEHIPLAVSIQTEIIPNEMRKLEDVSWNGFNMSSDLQDISGVKYRFYVSNDISGNEKMEDVVGNEDNTFTFDQSWNNVFCYGKEVDDFHTLDKQKIFALNFSATQEIDKIQQVEKTKLEEQTSKLVAAEAKIAALENTLADVLARLAALE